MNADAIEALKGFYRLLDESGPVNFPCGGDPEPADDSAGEGNDGDPEPTDIDPEGDDDGGDDGRDYIKKLREENKKKTQRAQRAEAERDELKTEVENLKRTFNDISVKLGLKEESKPEDILAKAEVKSREADEKVRHAALYTSFMIEAKNAGMPADLVPMAFKDSDFSEIEVNGMDVRGMAEYVTTLKARHPVLFTGARLEDGGEGATPAKVEKEPIKKEIEILAQRQGISVEAARKLHEKRVERARKKGGPTDFDTLWGIRRDYRGKII